MPVLAVAFKPNGSQLLACMGPRVLMYDTSDGKLLKSMKGHKHTVYSLSFSRDGTRFASGGADRCTVIWNEEGKGLLKFSHEDSIQVVSYNPVDDILASCSNSDFGFWSPKGKSVAKYKVKSKILSAAWTIDGKIIAIGMFSGVISLRNRFGAEQKSISCSSPIWCLVWNPQITSKDHPDVLVVGCWDKSLLFFQLSGTLANECKLDLYPCDVAHVNHEHIIVVGSGNSVILHSQEGIALCAISKQSDWIWTVKYHPKGNMIVVGDNAGHLSMKSLCIPSLYALHGDRLVYRASLTKFFVMSLLTRQKFSIECNGMVQKVSLYKHLLAIKLPNCMLLYENCVQGDPHTIQYKIVDKIATETPCDMFVMMSRHFVLCEANKVLKQEFSGKCVREWVLEAKACCIKADCGQDGDEGFLVGLENGMLLKIYMNNTFPIHMLSHCASIQQVTINSDRTYFALIDKEHRLFLYDIASKEVLFREEGVTSVAFNNEVSTLLCYTGDGFVTVRTPQTNVSYTEEADGVVISFRGYNVFLFYNRSIQNINISLSPIILHLLEEQKFDEAYQTACAGVSDSVWTKVANEALDAMSLDVAKQSFLRIKDSTFTDLILNAETQLKQCGSDAESLEKMKTQFQVKVALLRRRFDEAAKLYIQAGMAREAVSLYTSLFRWDDAKAVASAAKLDAVTILQRQAEWAEKARDWRLASDLYLESNDPLRAVNLIGNTKEPGWEKALMEIVRKIPLTEVTVLENCAKFFSESNKDECTKEVYMKLGDFTRLVQLHIQTQSWAEVAILCDRHPNLFDEKVIVPYAAWLAVQGRFEEAFHIYQRANQFIQGERLITQLTRNAIIEGRFKDVSYFYWLLATKTENVSFPC